MQCPACGAKNAPDLTRCSGCGCELPLEAVAVPEGDATGGVIPYKNPKALIAYYLGILSGLPLIGLPLGVAAFVLGIMGLQARRRNPAVRGSVHAGIGIGCGCLFTLLWSALAVMIVIAMVAER